jgi:spore germination protein GerM
MNRRSIIITVATFALIAVTAIVVVMAVRRKPAPVADHLREDSGGPAPAAVAPEPAAAGKKIKAQLFYVSDDGMRLVGVERDVPYAEKPVEQAREILNAQMTPVAAPLVSAVPPGTVLRALFLTESGQAYVDLSRDVASAHPGGSLSEMLTIYTIVHALTFNLPAVTAVQLLVDGKEVDTLAGHVDLRRPLSKNLQLAIED